MTVCDGAAVACLGGWRGDLLVTNRNGPLAPVAELGWDERTQTTPQRRLLLHGGQVFVLEPVSGHMLVPPLRARRFDLDGRELAREEGGDRGPAHLSFLSQGGRVVRCGIDPATGRPTVEEEALDLGHPGARSGAPLLAGGAVHYPVRMHGLFRGATPVFRGDPAPPQLVKGELACAGNRDGRPGVWWKGAWHELPGPRLFPDWRAPFGPLVAPHGDGLVVLRRGGGDLPGLAGAPPARLPDGIYSALFVLAGRLTALREEGPLPRLAQPGTGCVSAELAQ